MFTFVAVNQATIVPKWAKGYDFLAVESSS